MNKMAFVIVNGKLTIGDRVIDFPHPVEEALAYHDLIIVRVEPPAGVIFNKNVYGVSHEGKVLWQIEESPHGTQEDKPYVNIYIGQNDDLIAGNWNGVSYLVNPENGEITVVSFDK
jgi:hypothetical protein